jgi:hypothetical protein
MPASAYLTGPADYETYGVPLANPNNVQRASLLIDHFLHRPEGCIWLPDANGQPAYMSAMTPSLVVSAAASILPGTDVVVPLLDHSADADSLVGETVVIDRLSSGVVEVCVVKAVKPAEITLKSVQFAHLIENGSITLEFGLAITEERSLPSSRAVTRLSQWPVVKILSGLGRYAYGRRSDQMLGSFYDANLLSTLSAFGGPPAWCSFEVPASSLNPGSGDLWVPAGMLLSYYTDVKMRYLSGWSPASLPTQIKVACGAIVSALEAAPMGPQIRKFNSGKLTTERFADSVLDYDIKVMLRPYMALWAV